MCAFIGSPPQVVLYVQVWDLENTAADPLPPLRYRVEDSVTLWRVSFLLPWSCLVPDKQAHMTDVNRIRTRPAACMLLPDSPNMQSPKSTTIDVQNQVLNTMET